MKVPCGHLLWVIGRSRSYPVRVRLQSADCSYLCSAYGRQFCGTDHCDCSDVGGHSQDGSRRPEAGAISIGAVPGAHRAAGLTSDHGGLGLALPTAQAVAVILHELSTHAAKYGSLSVSQGQVDMTWSRAAGGRLILHWIESGGRPANKPTRERFGTSITDGMIRQLKGEIRRDWRAQGLACQIVLQL